MLPLDVIGRALIDPTGTIAGLRVLSAADKAAWVAWMMTSGLAARPLRTERFPSASTQSVTVSASVVKTHA